MIERFRSPDAQGEGVGATPLEPNRRKIPENTNEPFIPDTIQAKEETLDLKNETEIRKKSEKEEQENLRLYLLTEYKANEVLKNIDPSMSVSTKKVRVIPDDSREPYTMLSLSFKSDNPKMNWTMESGLTEEYINNNLERIIKKVHQEIFNEANDIRPKNQNSTIDEIYGDISQEEKIQLLNEASQRFNDQKFAELAGKEKQKNPEEILAIKIANEVTNAVLKKLGMKDVEIPTDNIHIIKSEHWPKNASALYNSVLQAIVIKERSKRLPLLKKIVHEMLHMKSFTSLQASSEKKEGIEERQLGLTTSENGVHDFVSINEAVTEDLVRRIMTENIDRFEYLQDDLAASNDLQNNNRNIYTKEGEHLFNEDTFYAYMDSGGTVHSENFTYKTERKILSVLIKKCFEKNKNAFMNENAVFDVFAKAMLSGEKEPLKELIDESFGKGIFVKLGEDGDSLKKLKFVSAL